MYGTAAGIVDASIPSAAASESSGACASNAGQGIVGAERAVTPGAVASSETSGGGALTRTVTPRCAIGAREPDELQHVARAPARR